jgi:16S rRNA (cytidine1402-2'-O)-methyltransferase
MEKGKLYVVSTPIGNLEDITLRALRILKEVQLIAAEDTRRTRKLLNFYQINTPLTSLHDKNEPKKSASLISKLSDGADIAYVSDAGTPGISDPGYILTNKAIDASIKVVPIPGPAAVIAALSVSGLPMDSFAFHAFLPSRSGKRKQFLESQKDETKTMVFYESPRRLTSTLEDIREILGDRNIVISRELTKIYEEVMRGKVSEFIKTLAGKAIKGEITLIVSGAKKITSHGSPEEIREKFNRLKEDSTLSNRDIVDTISEEMKVPRKDVYREVLLLLKK